MKYGITYFSMLDTSKSMPSLDVVQFTDWIAFLEWTTYIHMVDGKLICMRINT